MLLGRQQRFRPDEAVGAYWISRCRGFAVESPDGAGGVVEEVVFRDPLRPAAYLIVHEDGLFGRRRALAVDEVADVDPWARRIRLRGSFRACAKRTRRQHGVRGLTLDPG